MKKLLSILGSILIAVIVIVGAGVALTVVFKDRVPILETVPEAKMYEPVNRKEFAVYAGIENAQNATVVYESTNWELEKYGQELRYISGKIEPLTSLYDPARSSDIPTDMFSKSKKQTTVKDTQTQEVTATSGDTPSISESGE